MMSAFIVLFNISGSEISQRTITGNMEDGDWIREEVILFLRQTDLPLAVGDTIKIIYAPAILNAA